MAKKAVGDKVTVTEDNWTYEGIVVAVDDTQNKMFVSVAAKGKVIEQDNE